MKIEKVGIFKDLIIITIRIFESIGGATLSVIIFSKEVSYPFVSVVRA